MIGQKLRYSDGEIEFIGRIIHPEAAGEKPLAAVLVFHEAWGLTDHIVEMAAWLARRGMIAIACDMYGGGFVTDEMSVAGALIGGLRADPITMRRRACAALKAAQALPDVLPNAVTALGFCFGGTVALEMARDEAPLAGVVCVHGGLATTMPASAGAALPPILVCTGSIDPIVPLNQLSAFAEEMDAAGATWRALLLGGVKHSFTNPDSEAAGVPGAAYDRAADQETRETIWRFLTDVTAGVR